MDQVLLEMKNIHKRFPGVYALRGVSLALNAGEVLALVGENGAGKSTLINVLGGIHPKDEGEIWINGKPVDIDSVSDARQQGVSIIHQELVLVPHLTVAENIFLNREPQQSGFVDFKSLFENAQQFIDGLGLKINASEKIHRLTIAQQQIVEIVKAISFNAKMIVMDEPTSSLSENEIDALFENIKLLKAKGIGIIYISHRLSELPRIADRVVVLRDGQSVGTANIAEISNEEIVRMMVGREMTRYYTRTQHEIGDVALQIDHLTSHHVFDVSFKVHRGEILGFAGLVGAGRTEVMKVILGFDSVVSGDISIAGQVVKIKRPAEAYARKIGYIPENRREESLFALRSVSYNLTLRVLQSFIRGVRVNTAKEKSIVDEYSNKLSLKAASYETKIQNLSGGNQQKVVISRWLAAKPEILIMDEPTRGIDVGAKAEIYELMNTLAEQGMAIIMISSELPEVINISDRVLVMREGRVSGVLEKPDLTQEAIMKLAVNI